jgi:dUTP pyrophosphatase|tara:strand:- start:2402 stop:2992 length:591 start_codon:yes stop_codon:yes gene_type:complete
VINFHQCNIKIKKRELARLLEERDGISWAFEPVSRFDPFVYLRCCTPKPINIKANTTLPIPTGITAELNNPNFKMQVTTLSALAIKKGIIVLDSPATLDYTFRGEIWVMLHNISNEDVVIRTGERIAQFSIEPSVALNISYVDEVDTETPSLGMVKWISEHIKSKTNNVQKEQYPVENVSKEKILEILNLEESQND